MDGLCSECGLTFDWGRVLSPRAMGPEWSMEHRRGVRRWLATSRVSLRPACLTRELGIDHQVRAGRLVIFLLAWVAGWYVLFGLARFTLLAGPALLASTRSNRDWDTLRAGERALAWPYGTVAIPLPSGGGTEGSVLPMLILAYLPAAAMPLLMMILGETFARASVRKRHLLRAAAYSAPGATLFLHLMIVSFLCLISVSSPAGASGVEPFVVMATVVGYFVWLTRWWWLFVKRYLRLPHAGAIALVLMLTSVLGVVTAIACLAAWGNLR